MAGIVSTTQFNQLGAPTNGNLYLCLSSLTIMIGDSDLVKQSMQLANYCIDLLRQVAGIHIDGGMPPRQGSASWRKSLTLWGSA